MATSHPSILLTGEGSNLETKYLQRVNRQLPTFKTRIPFHKQGQPIPDYAQHHFGTKEMNVILNKVKLNTLPYYHFFGTSFPQINQPGFMSVIDKR